MSISTNDFLRFKGGIEQNDFTKILNLDSDENTIRVNLFNPEPRYFGVGDGCLRRWLDGNRVSL